MAVTYSAAAKKAMRKAAMRDPVSAMIAALPTHKVIAYIACASGHKAVVVDAREGDDVRSIVMEREQGKHGGGVVYLAHERQEDALFARSAMQGAAREDFIRHRVSMLQTAAAPYQERDPRTGQTRLEALQGLHPLSDEAEAASRAAVRAELEDGAYGVERNMRTPYWQQQLEGEWFTSELQDPNSWMPRSEDIYDIKPTRTPFMDLARQAMRGADFERKLEQVRKDQEELCGVKVSLDPAVGCDDFTMQRFVISGGRRAGKSAMVQALREQAYTGKSTEQMLIDAMQKLWGDTAKAPAYPDPSAERDALATARGGPTKPQNVPHKQEKPANPYPPPHPRVEAPAGLLAVSDMSARMGNRWMP